MENGEFVALYCLNSLFWRWIISWGGARWLEGWKSMVFLEWFAWGWNAAQIRLYALVAWGFSTLFSVAGLLKPNGASRPAFSQGK